MRDVTLQINLSPGDPSYARETVPPLIEAHKDSVDEVLLVVDCCRPQGTRIVDRERTFPKPEFEKDLGEIRSIASSFEEKGLADDVVFLEPEDDIIGHISGKYLRGIINETHDFGGTALMSYLAGLEIPDTQYVLHYDGDMLLHQADEYDWCVVAQEFMEESKAVAATPRVSPPFATERQMGDAPSVHPGRPFEPIEGGWKNDWFSTRCFLMDKEKLAEYLPLVQGRLLLETVVGKLVRHAYPRSPEMMFFKRIGKSGGWRLNLSSEQAWLLHPNNKGELFLELLPRIQSAISEGVVPEEQRGYANVDLEVWQRYFRNSSP